MAIENNLQLISYLAAAEVYNNNENIYECFLPIIESAVLCNSDKDSISFLNLQNRLQEIYHLDVPKSTLRRLLELLEEHGRIKFVNRRSIIPCKDELNNTFFYARQERENSINDFFISFNTYLVDEGIDIPLAEIKRFCCEWLYDHSLELAYFINSGILNNKTEKNNWEYASYLISFLLEIYEKKSSHFETFLLLYNGAIQSSLLNFETKQINTMCDSTLQFKNVLLDTNFILRMLNLQSEFDCITANETIEMLNKEGTQFYILEQTITEIQNSIKNFLDDSQSYFKYKKAFFLEHRLK